MGKSLAVRGLGLSPYLYPRYRTPLHCKSLVFFVFRTKFSAWHKLRKMRIFFMRIVSRKAVREATAEHPEWGALNAWYKIAKNADWKNFADVRNSWKNSDVVGRFVVFDISHNRCRLIATIKYKWRMVYIRRVLSHAEYDEEEWQKS